MKTLSSDVYLNMLSTLPVGVFLVDEKKNICEWNDWLANLTGISKEKALNASLDKLFPEVSTARFEFAVEQVLEHQHPQVLSQILNHYLIPVPLPEASAVEEAEFMQQSVSIFPILDAGAIYAMVVIQDVTENYHQRHMLLHVAKRFEEESVRDELTGLYNRRFLWEYLESELPKASREKYIVVCTVYDLDHFKDVNDDLGHKAGDEVLCSFVEVIKQNMRAGDTAFRHGGEEFITISCHVNEKEAGILASRIREEMQVKKQHGSVKRQVTCSAGFAIARPLYIPLSSESLVKHADEALYEAKKTGRNKVCAYAGDKQPVESKPVDLIDVSSIEKITHHDKVLQKELYSVFFEETVNNTPALKAAFSSENPEELVSGMHLLKASAKAVGAYPLAKSAEVVEFAARAADFKEIKVQEKDFWDLHRQTIKHLKQFL